MHTSGGVPPVNACEPSWRKALAEAIRDPDELCRVLALPDGIAERARAAARDFPLLVPRGFVARMRRGDPSDPLLRQVLPIDDETVRAEGFVADPLDEAAHAPTPGLLRKYRGRALLVTTGACAVHCRYCFRRHFPYGDAPRGRDRWSDAIAHIAADPTVDEVILSGGDPLTLPDAQLAELADAIGRIPHVARLRVHSRLPVVLPERVDDGLLGWLARARPRPVLVIHANHANELDASVADACTRLRAAGVTLLNQSVLLRGVNDDVDALAALSTALFAIGVLPYYLHALDRVDGAAHFTVADDRGGALVAELARRLPGYLVPRWVREVPGADGKVALRSG